ncbi:MAG TPA: hypothetical protein VGK17_15685, partial [Propionicimonas sp.]
QRRDVGLVLLLGRVVVDGFEPGPGARGGLRFGVDEACRGSGRLGLTGTVAVEAPGGSQAHR